MHQYAMFMADAVLRDRQEQLQRSLSIHAHLGDRSSGRSLRGRLAVQLVRLARIVEPGAAGAAGARDGAADAPGAVTPIAAGPVRPTQRAA